MGMGMDMDMGYRIIRILGRGSMHRRKSKVLVGIVLHLTDNERMHTLGTLTITCTNELLRRNQRSKLR